MISFFLTLILIHEYTAMDIDIGDVELPNNVLNLDMVLIINTWEKYHTHLIDFI